MKNILKKSFSIITLIAVIFSSIPVNVFAASVDKTVPTVYVSNPSSSSVYAGETVTYTVEFSDNRELSHVSLHPGNIDLHGFTATKTVTGTGNKRTVTLSNIQGVAGTSKYITIQAGAAVDTSGNKSFTIVSNPFEIKTKVVVDKTVPTVYISEPTPTSVSIGGTVRFTVEFSDNISVAEVKLDASYIDLHGFTATKTLTGTGNVRVLTLSNIQGTADSDNYITVKTGAAVDASGNKSFALDSNKFAIKAATVADKTVPTVHISNPSSNSVYSGETVVYTVEFSDNKAVAEVKLDASYIDLHGFTATKTVTGTGNKRTVTLSNIQGTADTDNYITVKAGAAVDASGNKSFALDSNKFAIKEAVKDTIPPIVKISAANPKSVYSGGTVKYTVTFTDNVKVTDVNLVASKVKLVGFTADVSVKLDGLKSAIITLKNVKGTAGVNKYIKIDAGVALDEPGNMSAQAISPKFTIVKKASVVTNTTVTKYTNNCIDDLLLLGDINKEITYFASWLRAEKYTATYVQENNYVAEDETMTYMVEYYNGSTAPAPEVTFDLTIPYKVVVEEINGNGKITKRTDNETVITWNVGTVPSYAASQGRGYCRLYVRVRFLENEALEKSDKISETFYATLKTTADGNHSYSYMRQLFIDTTEGKTGTYRSYLTTVDTTNQVRPDDEITRAEFAKLLADSGILDVVVGSNDYKTFKDHEKIPAYARDAVSALVKTNIIQAFPDGEFKPNNPILMEDAMQMIAQAATYISDQKLTVYKPVFLYTDALIGKDKKISEKKDYIMELMRQNVVVKYESNPDTYALRKHVVAMVNSLTFRGPYVEKLPENTLKYADIRDDSVFFYNIVGASNSYKYTYDYRLWQQIVEIVK